MKKYERPHLLISYIDFKDIILVSGIEISGTHELDSSENVYDEIF